MHHCTARKQQRTGVQTGLFLPINVHLKTKNQFSASLFSKQLSSITTYIHSKIDTINWVCPSSFSSKQYCFTESHHCPSSLPGSSTNVSLKLHCFSLSEYAASPAAKGPIQVQMSLTNIVSCCLHHAAHDCSFQ